MLVAKLLAVGTVCVNAVNMDSSSSAQPDKADTFEEWLNFSSHTDEDVPISFITSIAEDLFAPIFMKYHDKIRNNEIGVEMKGPADLVTEADKNIEKEIIAAIKKRYPTHSFIAEESSVEGSRLTDEPTWIIDPIDGTTNFVQGIPFCGLSIAFARKSELRMGVVCVPLLGETGVAIKGKGAWLKSNKAGKVTTTKLSTKNTEEVGKAVVAYGFSCPNIACLRPNAPKISDALRARYEQTEKDVNNNIMAIVKNCRDVRRLGSAACDMLNVAKGVVDAYTEFGIYEWDIAAGILLVEEAGGYVADVDGVSPYMLHGRGVLAGSSQALVKGLGALFQAEHRKLPSA